MPRKDGTGPIGRGPLSGKRMGFCRNTEVPYGLGMGFGRGGRCYPYSVDFKNEKSFLEKQRSVLEDHLKNVNERLKDIEE
ncbi:MAG: DUF5320 domain-containing protein [Clostridia bacterium]|nr:DUF5320 domain-containing protein [Clostridia bacterium]